MKRIILMLLVTAAMLVSGCGKHLKQTSSKEQPMFSHNVYFTLNDASGEKIAELIAECHRYLENHPGVKFFAVGQVSDEHDRPVNVRDFHVSLTVVFDSVTSHDLYQVAPDHLKFIERNKENWKQVRVFDSVTK